MAGLPQSLQASTSWPAHDQAGSSLPWLHSVDVGQTSPDQNIDGGPSRKRARKEQTFICSWTDCQRVFGKLEHLQRHERSHAGDVRYECPTCHKRFVRSDVMARHTALHGEASTAVKKPRKISCISCATLKVRCEGRPGTTCARCMGSGNACVYRSTQGTATASSQMSSPSSNPPPPSQDPYASSDGHVAMNGSSLQASFGSTPSFFSLPTPSSMNAAYPTSNLRSAMPLPLPLPVPSDDFSNLPLESLYGFMMESSDSYFGWDMGDIEWDHMKSLSTHAPGTPSADWLPDNPLEQPILPTQASAFQSDPPPPIPPPSPGVIGDAQPADTPWPHVYKPSIQDSRLNLPTISQKSRPTLHEADLDRVSDSTRDAMLSLVSVSHQPHWPEVDVAAFPSTRTLSVCVNLYFRHFHEAFPIIRRSTFRASDVPPVLLLAMAAIGAMYSRDGLNELAVAMNELARRAIAYLRETDRRVMFDTAVVQAWLLQSVFGLFCGSRMLYQHAEISRGGLVTAARRMHLLRPSLSFVEELGRRRVTATAEEFSRACADDEERRRLGWGIYLYDAQIACLLNISPLFSIGEVNMPLPSDEETWNAPASAANMEPEVPQPKSPNIRRVLDSLISTGKLPQTLNPFGFSLIAHTLFRLCTDACEVQTVLSLPWAAMDSPYKLAFPPTFKHNPQELLDQLSSSCYNISCTPNSLIVSVSALSHLGHIQFTWPGFLDNIKIAAGKSGTENSKNDARFWLSARISQDPVNARSILVHAGQISALLLRFTSDTPSETVWMFDAALTFWAMVKFGAEVGGISGSPNRTSVTWSEFDDVEGWIQNGGPVSFQGLGDFAALTAYNILSIFSERLENMPWGIAQWYRHVLMNLSKEEM